MEYRRHCQRRGRLSELAAAAGAVAVLSDAALLDGVQPDAVLPAGAAEALQAPGRFRADAQDVLEKRKMAAVIPEGAVGGAHWAVKPE